MSDFADFTIEFPRGDTCILEILVTQDGAAKDVSLWTKFWVSAKLQATDTSTVVALTSAVGGGITLSNPLAGVLQATVPAAATRALANRLQRLYVDVQGQDAEARLWTLARGTFVLLPEITEART